VGCSSVSLSNRHMAMRWGVSRRPAIFMEAVKWLVEFISLIIIVII
jgi:hypothetical protein